MKNKIDISELFITVPTGASKLFHVFGKDNRSLCGKFGLLVKNPEYCQPVKGDEIFKKGEDCKSCFNKIPKINETIK